VLDAGALARFGRVEVEPGSTGFDLLTRTGNVEQPVRAGLTGSRSRTERCFTAGAFFAVESRAERRRNCGQRGRELPACEFRAGGG